jgi:penicillin-binding protein 1A
MKKILLVLAFLAFLALGCGAIALVWGYNYITRDLPRMDRVEDYRPDAASFVRSADGKVIAEYFDERRYPAKIDEIPVHVRQAFLAAEDASFYQHPGIDIASIFRAVLKNLEAGSASQGGSTITQQVVKNLLLTSEKKLIRKAREALLAYRLEQRLSKDDILEIYLNQIFFGNGAYGIRAAARIYFHKELADVSIAEGAMLAGLPKAPSRYSPVTNPKGALRRQRYVLKQMASSHFISEEEAKQALEERIEVYRVSQQNVFSAPYFVSEVRKSFEAQFPDYDIDRDGLTIETSVDSVASDFAEKAVQRGLREIDKRRGWRGPLAHYVESAREQYTKTYAGNVPHQVQAEKPYPALVLEKRGRGLPLVVLLGDQQKEISLQQASWANRLLDKEDRAHYGRIEDQIQSGDVVEIALQAKDEAVSADQEKKQAEVWQLDQTPEIQSALVLIEPSSGKVVALVGGYDYSQSSFNRVTQALRQPGSSFKPVVYLAAVDGFQYTPATIVYDTPRTFRVGNDVWQPANFDKNFLGGIPLRMALEKSRNLVSADIVSRIGIEAVIRYAVKLGIKTPLHPILSLSLGASEVTPLEITRAYGVFAAGGILFDSVFITKVSDREGKVIFDYDQIKLEKGQRAIDEKSAFIMANMMKGVVERGTGWRVRSLNRPIAGKTGTSNDQMDAWFIGYSPQWVCGVWTGFDVKRTIGKDETGGKAAAPIFIDFMGKFLNNREQSERAALIAEAKQQAEDLGVEYQEPEASSPPDFPVPEGVDAIWVNKHSGTATTANAPDALLDYFIHGSEPGAYAPQEEVNSYLESSDL